MTRNAISTVTWFLLMVFAAIITYGVWQVYNQPGGAEKLAWIAFGLAATLILGIILGLAVVAAARRNARVERVQARYEQTRQEEVAYLRETVTRQERARQEETAKWERAHERVSAVAYKQAEIIQELTANQNLIVEWILQGYRIKYAMQAGKVIDVVQVPGDPNVYTTLDCGLNRDEVKFFYQQQHNLLEGSR